MDTTENNKIIAEFMGLNETKMFFNLKTGNYVKKETDDCDIKAVDVFLKNNKPITNFYYHSDWNWLMEVVRKIRYLETHAKGEFLVELLHYKRNNRTIFDLDILEGIEYVYNAVVSFIEWYNKQ